MTIKEVCEKYGYAESTVKTQFTKVQAKILKEKHIKLVKKGRGAAAYYEEEVEPECCRALTMFQEEPHELLLTEGDVSFVNWTFHVFLALVTTPMRVFRGTVEQLCQYMDIPVTPANKDACKIAIDELVTKKLIQCSLDPTDENYFTMNILRKTEREYKINYQMLLTCKELAEKANKKKWLPLLKTWIGVQMLEENQPYTVAQLQSLTGLSAYQLRECNKILKDNDIYKTSRAYAAMNLCLGTNVELNAFYNQVETNFD